MSADNNAKRPPMTAPKPSLYVPKPGRVENMSETGESAAPKFVLELEKRKKFTLGHEQGAGNPCEKCGTGCPGFDLHFWRKICTHCKCGKQEHGVEDKDNFHRIERLLGPRDSKPLKWTALEVVDPKSSETKGRTLNYEWVPPNINADLAKEYMKNIPINKQPIEGSEGAAYRKRQLEYQVPPHDIDDNLYQGSSADDKSRLNEYVANLKEFVIGQGEVCILENSGLENDFRNLSVKSPNSLELACTPPPPLVFSNTPTTPESPDWPPPPPPGVLEPFPSPTQNIPPSFPPPPPPLSPDTSAEKKPSGFVTGIVGQPGDIAVKLDLGISCQSHCQQCEIETKPGDVVVCAERAGSNAHWHPQCFVCHTCQELLVDLIYFYAKGHIYCGRHYAQSAKIPRCRACDELIFNREYTMADGESYHVNHFCCYGCDVELAGKQYVQMGDPFCLACYNVKFGKVCNTCQELISPEAQRVSHSTFHWHAVDKCFCCSVCKQSLVSKRFLEKEGNIFCSKECRLAMNMGV